MLDIMNVANYIYAKDPGMTHKKLQKLCYYCQAWHLAFKGVRLIKCEFEAWVHGPVCMELYAKRNFVNGKYERESITKEEMEFIDRIYSVYMKYSASILELMTHNEDPWIEARGELQSWEPSRAIISTDSMKCYYSGKINNT